MAKRKEISVRNRAQIVILHKTGKQYRVFIFLLPYLSVHVFCLLHSSNDTLQGGAAHNVCVGRKFMEQFWGTSFHAAVFHDRAPSQ